MSDCSTFTSLVRFPHTLKDHLLIIVFPNCRLDSDLVSLVIKNLTLTLLVFIRLNFSFTKELAQYRLLSISGYRSVKKSKHELKGKIKGHDVMKLYNRPMMQLSLKFSTGIQTTLTINHQMFRRVWYLKFRNAAVSPTPLYLFVALGI